MILSVIIINYNKAKFIRENLNSLLNQTNKNFELIIYDDNSSDNSFQIYNEYKIKFKKIKIIRNLKIKNNISNFNQLKGIETVLKSVSGDFIIFLDSDDYFSQNKIEEISKVIKRKKYKLILNSYYNLYGKKRISNERHYKIRNFIYPIFPPTSCITIEKKFLKKIFNKININRFPTCWFDFRILVYFTRYYENNVIYLKDKLTYYRFTDNGADQIYTKIYKFNFWKRKIEAMLFYFFLKK